MVRILSGRLLRLAGPAAMLWLSGAILSLAACPRPAAAGPARPQLLAQLSATATPPGWADPIVPRLSGDATEGGPLAVPDTLPGWGLTWFNWVTHKNPALAGTWTDALYLDDRPIESLVRIESAWVSKYLYAINQGPSMVRGGRHTLKTVADLYYQTNEDYDDRYDNSWSHQWVWSPFPLAKSTWYSSAAPPPVEPWAPLPNSLGYRLGRDTGSAWVVALQPYDPADNYDLIVYDDYSGSGSGFSHAVARSSQAAYLGDFVVGSSVGTPAVLYPAAIRVQAGSESNFAVGWADAAGRRDSTGNGEWPSERLEPYQLARAYEVRLGAGKRIEISLTRFMGTSDLAFAVFPPTPGGIWTRAQALASSTPRQGQEYDLLDFTATEGGWYPIVVYRPGGDNPAPAMGYRLAFGNTLLDVETGELPLFFGGAAPDPARDRTRFAFALTRAGAARLALYDLQGRLVRVLVDGWVGPGRHDVEWDLVGDGGASVGPGLYWARFDAEGRSFTKRLTVLR